jgi:hypothetical protein
VQGAAAWFSVKVCVAIVAVPVRAPSGLAAMFNCTDPAPAPAALEARVAQGTLEAAVHGQCAGADTVTVELPPAAGSVRLVGVMV